MSVYRPQRPDPHAGTGAAMVLLWALIAAFAAFTFLSPFMRCR